MQNRIPRTAIAVEAYLPYTMSWIYRQMQDERINTQLVITNHLENIDLFAHNNILELNSESYFLKVIKAKLWSFFGNRNIELSIKNKALVKQALIEQEIELVHVHFGTFAVYLIDLCNELGIPMVVTFHGFDISSAFNRWPAYKLKFNQLIKDIQFAIVISEEMKLRMIDIGCENSKIKVSYLGVPLDEFKFIDRRNKDGVVKFIHAGRLTAKKGVVDLVRVFCNSFKGRNDAILLIAGDGETKIDVEKEIEICGSSGIIQLLGKLTNDQLASLRSEADVFVLNCRTDQAGTKEGLPIATLEAASTGLPVVSTNHAGIPESVICGLTGILVDEYDDKSLAEALVLMMDSGLRIKYGRNARKFMEEKFDLIQCNEVLRCIYEEAIKK